LHRLGDHAARVRGQLPRILPVRAPVDRAGQPRRERLAEPLEARRRQREQPGAVVRAAEGDDPGPPRREQRRPQRDLDRVLAADAELRRPGQPPAQRDRHLRLGEVAERVDDRLLRDRRHDAGIAMAERGDAEAGGEVDVLASLGVPDARALGARPDHRPLRRGCRSRPTVSAAT
jgi:hypothetical protein